VRIVIVDSTLDMLGAALRGLGARQRATADNIANTETPGFLAERVEFEDELRRAAASGDTRAVEPSVRRASDPVNQNGNNVSLDDEMVTSVETGLRYQLVVGAVNNKVGLIRTAIGRRA
jgi:flagellar basal-body rod protein FlgB